MTADLAAPTVDGTTGEAAPAAVAVRDVTHTFPGGEAPSWTGST